MDKVRADELRRELMLDHDVEPNELTDTLDEFRALQKASDSPEILVERYQKASLEIIDFFDRLYEHALHEAECSGGFVDFSDSSLSQIILDCVRGYPEYRSIFEGTNSLLNEEQETSRKLGRQIFEIAQEYQEIIQGLKLEE